LPAEAVQLHALSAASSRSVRAQAKTPGAPPPGKIDRHRPNSDMRLIDHRRRLAAIAAERAHLHPHIQAREPDDPGPRFVAALCPRPAVNTGQADCAICDQEDAERFARARLMPAEAFAPVAARSDTELAELYAAPLDQVAIPRREAGGEDAAAP
jgi:hypothetical protein